MLDLNHPYVLAADEISLIASVKLSHPNNGNEQWRDSRVRALKHNISVHTLREQKCQCAYCERLLQKGSVQIEHIISKGNCADFVFEPLNLVTSCTVCNGPCRKGQQKTYQLPICGNYRGNIFTIVHPYLDNPDSHIVFMDADRTIFDLAQCSKKGLATIEMFGWGTLNEYHVRMGNALMLKLPRDITNLINEISCYKVR